jgi:hypothetical protein
LFLELEHQFIGLGMSSVRRLSAPWAKQRDKGATRLPWLPDQHGLQGACVGGSGVMVTVTLVPRNHAAVRG